MRVVVIADDGTETDVTEPVRTLYDLLESSMDWGSGFLSIEDVIEVSALAGACGFKSIDEVQEQITAYLRTSTGWPCLVCAAKTEGFAMGPDTDEGRMMTVAPCGHRHTIHTEPDGRATLTAATDQNPTRVEQVVAALQGFRRGLWSIGDRGIIVFTTPIDPLTDGEVEEINAQLNKRSAFRVWNRDPTPDDLTQLVRPMISCPAAAEIARYDGTVAEFTAAVIPPPSVRMTAHPSPRSGE